MKKITLILSSFVMAFAITSCGGEKTEEAKDQSAKEEAKAESAIDVAKVQKMAKNVFKPLPEPASFETPLAKLGKKLYYETELSISGEMSCNSCHMLDNYGVDNEPTSPGHKGERGERNSPTVYNAWFHIAQFWDGRAADLVEQAKGPILNPVEMGMPDEATVEKKLKASDEYQSLFAEAFPEEEEKVNYHNMAVAIAEFERTLATPAPIDDFLNGKADALTEAQVRGLNTFMNTGCITCHTGPGFGGNMYQKFGLINGTYWDYTGSERQDEGRFAVTGNEGDKYFFKVPSLRNITKTAPYFHDGSVADLEEAVKIMATTQLNKELSEQEVNDIVSFLEALTGEIPSHALQNEQMASL